MNTPLNTAHLRNPGKISTLEHLHGLVSQGNHVPVWLARPLAAQILAQHGHNNAAVAHPGVPIPLPPAQIGPQNQPLQRMAVGGVVPPPGLGPTPQLQPPGRYGQPMPGDGMIQNAQSPTFQIPFGNSEAGNQLPGPHPNPVFLGPPIGAPNAKGLSGLQIGQPPQFNPGMVPSAAAFGREANENKSKKR